MKPQYICPQCKSDDGELAGDSPYFKQDGVVMYFRCVWCETDWWEKYKFTDYQVVKLRGNE